MTGKKRAGSESISDIFDKFIEEMDGSTIKVNDLIEAFGVRNYGPFLFLIGMIALSPIGGIPGAGILCGSIAIIFTAQFFFFTNGPWLPKKIREVTFSLEKTKKKMKEYRPFFKKVEKFARPRLHFLTSSPFNFINMAIVILLGLTFIPMAVIPWGITFPALAYIFLGLAITAHDGILLIIGHIFSACSFLLCTMLFL